VEPAPAVTLRSPLDERATGLDGEDPADGLDQLAAAARSGDRPSLADLLSRDYDRLHAICWKLLRDDEDALDATQEAALSIARHIRGFDGRSRYTTWSHRIAVNAALDLLRRRQRRGTLLSIDPATVDAQRLARVGDEQRVAGVVADRLTVRRALDELPVEQRTALLLRHMLDLDYAEIAETLGVPVGTVRSRIARGRAALAERLADRNSPAGAAVEPDEAR
jgi:RNA polymerase sigma-70 factor (ECF subfamily)